MKNNNLLTYVLYGLLAAFILAAGYYACQKQKEKKELAAKEAAELDEVIQDMGYGAQDTVAADGSTFSEKDSLAKPGKGNKTVVSKDGIEENPANNKTTTTKPNTSGGKTSLTNTVQKPSSGGASSGSKKSVSAVKGPGSGRWAVRAGTFAYMEGARKRLEEVIKAGFPNAEISKTKEGKAAVVVFRSNDKNAAIKVADKLEEKGFDAAVFDRTQ